MNWVNKDIECAQQLCGVALHLEEVSQSLLKGSPSSQRWASCFSPAPSLDATCIVFTIQGHSVSAGGSGSVSELQPLFKHSTDASLSLLSLKGNHRYNQSSNKPKLYLLM